MQYRTLGATGLQVSAIGLGCGQLGSPSTAYAVHIVRRALELGVTFFDVARLYRDAEIKLGLGLKGERHKVIVSTKTMAKTREDAWRDINESLERLGMDYVDNCHLHDMRPGGADLNQRLGPGGALEALVEAKRQGLVRHIGATSHLSEVLIEAIRRFDFEVILVPMNIVEQEPLARLIPLCQEKGIGVTIMKPLATGLLPSRLALRWLLNQPIVAAVPGATTIEEMEQNALAGYGDLAFTAQEQARAAEYRQNLEQVRCRVCFACLPCHTGANIPSTLGTDVMFDHYRTMGREAFRAFPWSRSALEKDRAERRKTIEAIDACDRCGDCQQRCPYGLPVIDMLQAAMPAMRDIMNIYDEVYDAAAV
jgi:uncharacterized protein